MLERKAHGDPAAHGVSGNHCVIDGQSIEQPGEIIDEPTDRIGPDRLLRVAMAAQVGSDHVAPLREVLDLWPPSLSSLGIPVHEDQSLTVTPDIATQRSTRHRDVMDGHEILVVAVPNGANDIARYCTLKGRIATSGSR